MAALWALLVESFRSRVGTDRVQRVGGGVRAMAARIGSLPRALRGAGTRSTDGEPSEETSLEPPPHAAPRTDTSSEAEVQVTTAERPARPRAFVCATLVSFFTALAAVLVLNTVVDPFAVAGTGLLPTAVENDRAIKLTLIDRLEKRPGVLILGSSRGRQAEPAYLETLTGRSGFNGAVGGGTAADAWVMTRHLDAKFSARGRGYVWFVDPAIATHGVNPQLAADPRAKPYLRDKRAFRLSQVGEYLGTEASKASIRVLTACALRGCRANQQIRYLPDGSFAPRSLQSLPERAESLRRSIRRHIEQIRADPPRPIRTAPRRLVYIERALAFMNRHGSTPVIVLNPIHPAILAELRRHAWAERRRAMLATLAYLRERHRFVVVDAQNISAWRGTRIDWNDSNHVNRLNMRRLLRHIVARSHGALR